MSHPVLAAIVVPVVVVLALAVWLTAIYRARRHPRTGSGSPLRHEVAGAFRGTGGQPVMPGRDAVPAEVPDPGPQDAEARPEGERRPTGLGPAGLGRRLADPAGGQP
jgi:hypothetical protein